MRVVCKHYGVQLIELQDIEKQNGHPSIAGMKSICEQILEATGDGPEDIVATALSNQGKVDLGAFRWTREPAKCEVKGDKLYITTAPHPNRLEQPCHRIHQRLNAKALFGAAMIDWEQGGVLNPLLFLPRKFFPADWFSCDILFQ